MGGNTYDHFPYQSCLSHAKSISVVYSSHGHHVAKKKSFKHNYQYLIYLPCIGGINSPTKIILLSTRPE